MPRRCSDHYNQPERLKSRYSVVQAPTSSSITAG
jgi:hypothetical protein